MAYLVLARKYRPERFADMVGQEHVTRTLQNAIANGRLHHAYLLCGVRGLGKTTAARILAKCLVCEEGPAREPCNRCSQCVAVSSGHSVDVVEIDGASNNSVDDVRALREQVNYLPQFARRKIYIIDEVHMLSGAAFNALLKTLEEPPDHVTFIFATTDPHKVLPTIMSRVSRLDLRRVPGELLVGHLRDVLGREGVEVEEEGLRIVSQGAEGSVRDALTLLDKVLAFASDPVRVSAEEVRTILGQPDRLAIADIVQAVLEHDPVTVLERFDELARRSNDLPRVGVAILQHLRDLAVVRAYGDASAARGALLDVSDTVLARLADQASQAAPVVVAQLFDRFTHVIEALEDSRVPRLLLEMGLLDLAHAEPLVPVSELVQQLASMARGRGGAPDRGEPGPGRGGQGPERGGSGSSRGPQGDHRGSMGGGDWRSGAEPASAPPRAQARARPVEPIAHAQRPGTGSERPAGQAGSAAAAGSGADARADEPGRGSSPRAGRALDTAAHGPLDSRQDPEARAAPAAASPFAAALWKMVGRDAQREHDEPPEERPSRPAADPRPTIDDGRGPPLASSAPSRTFRLHAEEDRPEPAHHLEAAAPDAGCPSSRCTPRDVIPWERLEPFAAWESLLVRIREEDDYLFAVLGGMGLARLDSDGLVLAGAHRSFAREQLARDPELRVRLEGFMRDYFGVALRVELLDAAPSLPDLPSFELMEVQRRADFQARLVEEARANPKIQALMEQFGASLRQVRPVSADAEADSSATLEP